MCCAQTHKNDRKIITTQEYDMKTVKNIQRLYIAIIVIVLSVIMACVFPPHEKQAGSRERAGDVLSNSYYHYSLGVLLAINGETDRAITEYESALRSDPESPYLINELAALYMKKGKMNKAVELLERSVALDPDNIDSYILLGGLYGNLKRYDDAAQQYKRVIDIDPEKIEAYLFLGLIYRENTQYEKAIEILGDLLKRDPGNLMGNYHLARVYVAMNRYDEAETYLQKTLDIKPTFKPALIELGMLYRFQNKDDKAMKVYRDFLQIDTSGGSDVRFELGNILLKLKEYTAAAEEFEKILELDNSLTDVHFSLGLAYFFSGEEYDKAIEEFLTVLESHPDNYRAVFFLAGAYEEKGQYEDAIQELGSIPERSDIYTAARIRMGFILKKDGYAGEAIELLRKEVEKNGKDPEVYRFLAALYEEEDMIDDAEDILEKALILFPDDVDLRYRLGVLYGKENKHQESIREMEAVLKLDPNNVNALNFIGYSYAERGIKLDEAEKLVKKALLLKPGSAYIIDSLGWVYFRQGRLELAIELLEKAFDLLPDEQIIPIHLGDAYKENGQMKKALEIYKRALECDPDNKTLKEKIRNIRIPGE